MDPRVKGEVKGWQQLNGGKGTVEEASPPHPSSHPNPYLKLNLKLITNTIHTTHTTQALQENRGNRGKGKCRGKPTSMNI